MINSSHRLMFAKLHTFIESWKQAFSDIPDNDSMKKSLVPMSDMLGSLERNGNVFHLSYILTSFEISDDSSQVDIDLRYSETIPSKQLGFTAEQLGRPLKDDTVILTDRTERADRVTVFPSKSDGWCDLHEKILDRCQQEDGNFFVPVAVEMIFLYVGSLVADGQSKLEETEDDYVLTVLREGLRNTLTINKASFDDLIGFYRFLFDFVGDAEE